MAEWLSEDVDVDTVGVSDEQSVPDKTHPRWSTLWTVNHGCCRSQLGVQVKDTAVVTVGDEAAVSGLVCDDVPRVVEMMNVAISASCTAE